MTAITTAPVAIFSLRWARHAGSDQMKLTYNHISSLPTLRALKPAIFIGGIRYAFLCDMCGFVDFC